jgi:hypothetical protein
MKFLPMIIIMFSTSTFAMEWTGDVLLKNIYNNNGKNITIDIMRDGKILTHAEFAAEKNVPQPWVTRLQSQKNDRPNSISIKQLGFIHIPTGAIKEFDLIIEKNGVLIIPTGTKDEERAEEERSFAIKGLTRKSLYSMVNITAVENNSSDHVVIIIKDENKKNIDTDIPAKTTRMVNLEIAQGKEFIIETRYNKKPKLYTYTPDGKFENLRIVINALGVASIAEGAAASPQRVSPRGIPLR